jgi:hypothetical protein
METKTKIKKKDRRDARARNIHIHEGYATD